MLKGLSIVLSFVVLLVLFWAHFSRQGFERKAESERGRLLQLGQSPASNPLPEALQRAVELSGDLPSASQWVELQQEGHMRLKPDGPWIPFKANHLALVDRPGFVWCAEMEMLPLVPVLVCDSYVEGRGRLEARIGGFITIAHEEGNDLALGELFRYYAELPWLPQGFAAQQNAQWSQGPDGVQLLFEADGNRGEVRYRFNALGQIDEVHAQRPNANVGGRKFPWTGRFSDYQDFGGLSLPAQGEVSWGLPGGEWTYWKGRIISVKFGP
ncbi:MAG: hypothetical protein RRB13_12215 [bacterium]|nr:hypothetical protein [bacterium]